MFFSASIFITLPCLLYWYSYIPLSPVQRSHSIFILLDEIISTHLFLAWPLHHAGKWFLVQCTYFAPVCFFLLNHWCLDLVPTLTTPIATSWHLHSITPCWSWSTFNHWWSLIFLFYIKFCLLTHSDSLIDCHVPKFISGIHRFFLVSWEGPLEPLRLILPLVFP